MPLGVRKDEEDKEHHGQNDRKEEKKNLAWQVFRVYCQRDRVKWSYNSLGWCCTHTGTVCYWVLHGGWIGEKSPSFDIQIIFRDSNKKLVPSEPLGSLAATICSSSAFSSSVSLLYVSSPTECVSAPCYFKANAAWGPFRLSQAAACSVLVQPTVGTGDCALCLPPPLPARLQGCSSFLGNSARCSFYRWIK